MHGLMPVPKKAKCWMDDCKQKVRAHVRPPRDDFGFLTCSEHLLSAISAQANSRGRAEVSLYAWQGEVSDAPPQAADD